MPDIEKLIEKWKQNPTDVRYKTVKLFLEHFGYTLFNVKGSHFGFKKQEAKSINVIVHQKHVKKWYIKRLLKTLNILQ